MTILSARMMFGWSVGLLAGLLLTLSPDVVNWSQKARPYSLQLMFCALAFWGMISVVRRTIGADAAADTPASRRESAPDAKPAWSGWGVYAIGAAGAMLTQHTAGFFCCRSIWPQCWP